MDKLEHDPQAKSTIKDALYDYLYGPIIRNFKDRVETIITRNTMMGGYSHKSFIYKGKHYSADPGPMPLRSNRLVPALRAPMDEFLADQEALNSREIPLVVGFLTRLLNSSPNITDYMRVLPESVHQPLRQLMATCPCRATTLTQDRVESLVAVGEDPIRLMKERLVINLIL